MKQVLFFLLGVALISCDSGSNESTDDNFDRQAMLVNWADNIIVPAYKNYEGEVDALEAQAVVFTNAPTEESLATLRAKWRSAYLAWQWVAIFEIGVAETNGLQGYTNMYPANIEEIESSMLSGSYNLELPSRRDQQGFPALDYLIYGLASSDAEILAKYENNVYKTYLTDLAKRLQTLTSEVVNDWESGYRDTFVNNDGSSATGAVNKLTNDYIFYFEKHLRASKVGIPAGVFSGTPDPTDVEAYYASDFSKELFNEALACSKAFFNGQHFGSTQTGEGFKTYLDYLNSISGGTDLAQQIIDQFAAIESTSSSLTSSFSQQVESNNELMLNTYDELQKNVINFKIDMLQLMNVKVDYVDADGD
ncbi:imelysin family protein [Reichenbachiella sp.]|uniref:imelysin family protein n=1 Tax=Reichenbachiella sp. TaxID=2184521 RepID=UPI00329778B9